MATVYNSQLDAFELYHAIQEDKEQSSYSPASRAVLRALSDGLSGAIGASISNVATYPLDLIITRLQIQRQLRKNASQASEDEYKGFQDAYQKITKRDGWKGLYAGLLSDTGKTIADSFLFFLMYDFMRKARLQRGTGGVSRKTLPALEELSVGFIAGSLTKLCTTPIANVVTRQQAASLGSSGDSSQEVDFHKIAQQILDEKGPSGFWSGYSASLILTLNPSLTFFFFEFLKKAFLPRATRDNPPALATFVLAATSKAVASSVTYPFSLAKSRLQAGKPEKEAEDEDNALKDELPGSKSSQKKARKAARQTIFSTLLAIAHNEGMASLYEGLHLEIVKAFFSHGTTMLVKQIISRLLLQFSTLISLVYRRVKRRALAAEKLRIKAQQSGYEYYDLAIKRSSDKFEDLQKVAQQTAQEAGKRLQETTGFVADYIDDEVAGDNGAVSSVAKWLGQKGDGKE